MGFLLLVNNLLSQNCYTFAVYSQLCLNKTQGNYIPLCPRRQLRPINSQFKPNQHRGRSSNCRHLFRHWWRIKDYQSTLRLYLCKHVAPNCKMSAITIQSLKRYTFFPIKIFWIKKKQVFHNFFCNLIYICHKHFLSLKYFCHKFVVIQNFFHIRILHFLFNTFFGQLFLLQLIKFHLFNFFVTKIF